MSALCPAARWKDPNPDDPSQTLGEAVMGQRDIRYARLWVWVGWAIVIAWTVGMNFLITLAMAYLDREYPAHILCCPSHFSTLPVAYLENDLPAQLSYTGGGVSGERPPCSHSLLSLSVLITLGRAFRDHVFPAHCLCCLCQSSHTSQGIHES